MTVDIVRTLAKYGPRRFYVLNTGRRRCFRCATRRRRRRSRNPARLHRHRVSTGQRACAAGADTDEGAAHADEVETSIMLFVDPSAVDMRKAVASMDRGRALTRQKDAPGSFSATGVVGDPTLATPEKGQAFVEALVAGALDDIEAIRAARLPVAKPGPRRRRRRRRRAPSPPLRARGSGTGAPPARNATSGCSDSVRLAVAQDGRGRICCCSRWKATCGIRTARSSAGG